MTITFTDTDSVGTAMFNYGNGSIKINLRWWGSLSNADKALIIVHQLETLKEWRYNTPADYVINADMVLDELVQADADFIELAGKGYSQ